MSVYENWIQTNPFWVGFLFLDILPYGIGYFVAFVASRWKPHLLVDKYLDPMNVPIRRFFGRENDKRVQSYAYRLALSISARTRLLTKVLFGTEVKTPGATGLENIYCTPMTQSASKILINAVLFPILEAHENEVDLTFLYLHSSSKLSWQVTFEI